MGLIAMSGMEFLRRFPPALLVSHAPPLELLQRKKTAAELLRCPVN
jgi:hypothetical protein